MHSLAEEQKFGDWQSMVMADSSQSSVSTAWYTSAGTAATSFNWFVLGLFNDRAVGLTSRRSALL